MIKPLKSALKTIVAKTPYLDDIETHERGHKTMISSNFQRQQAGGYEYLDDYHAIQLSTSEVVAANWAHLPVGTIAYTPEQQEIYKDKKEAEQRRAIMRHTNAPLGNFLFADATHRYADVSPQTMARLIYISTFLPYGERELKGRKNIPMTKGDVKKATKLSEATFFRFWNEVSGKYLFENSNSHIYVSNNFKRGKLPKSTKHMEYQKIYIQAVRSLYESCPTSKHKHLGRIFQMLPFVNTEYNILCFTPQETNIDSIIPMTLNEFCTTIGMSSEKRTRLVREYAEITLPVHGRNERFCSFVFDGLNMDSARIFINPRILYRGSDWNKVAVLGAFTTPQEIVNTENTTLSVSGHF